MLAFKAAQQFFVGMERVMKDFEITDEGQIMTTLFFKPPFGEKIGFGRSVKIYGEFTSSPWKNFIPCYFDE